MAKYRKVDSRIWNDAKFRTLSDSAKLVFFFLLTHPNMTSLGAMRHSVPGMAAEIGWEPKAFREPFQELLSKGLVKHDEMASFVWLPNFIKYNQPENPNVVKAWKSALDLLPECAMYDMLLQHVKEFLKGFKEPFRKGFEKGLPKSMANPEPEPEPDYKDISPGETDPVSSGQHVISLPCQDGTDCIFGPDFIATLQTAYPQVDIVAQAKKAKAWLHANPSKKKTRRGMKKFLNNWLANAQKDAEQKSKAALPATTGRARTKKDIGVAPWVSPEVGDHARQ